MTINNINIKSFSGKMKSLISLLNPFGGKKRKKDIFNEYNELFSNILIEVNINQKINFVDYLGLKFFGITNKEIHNGISLTELFPDSHFQIAEKFNTISDKDSLIIHEHKIRDHNGDPIHALFRTKGIYIDKTLIGYRNIIVDISKHKDTEDQLIKEKAFLKALFDFSPEATAITDINSVVLQINNEFTRLFGYTGNEAINKNISELIIPKELQKNIIGPSDYLTENPSIDEETIRMDKSGNRMRMHLSTTAVIIDEEIIAYIKIYRNITMERKYHLLHKSLFNISSAALDLPRPNDIYQLINKELSNIWITDNFYIAMFDTKSASLYFPFFADENDSYNKIPKKKTLTGWVIDNKKAVLLKHNDFKRLEEQGVIELVGTDCKVWMGAPLEIENNIIGVICLQDYNDENRFSEEDLNLLNYAAKHIAMAIERRMLLNKLMDAKKAAEEAADTKQSFLSTMSHEIRTPLNEVVGIANILLQEEPRKNQIDYIKSLLFSSNNLLTLINDVLDFSKIDAGKIEFENITFNFNDYLDDLKKSFSIRASSKHISFELKCDPNVPQKIIGDQTRLNQVISNLFSNALKFTQKGEIKIVIKELKRTNNISTIEFRVEDTGIGIPKEKLNTVFENFTQASVSTSREYGGTGLGLAISKRIVELNNGKLKVKSSFGIGSTFYFSMDFKLPLDANQLENKSLSLTDHEVILEGKKILIAEDNRINFMVANKILSTRGLVISHAENGKIAVDKAMSETFDLILMDIHMPELDGIDATQQIRNSDIPQIRNLPIVALTAVSISECKDKLEDVRFDGYIMKPFKPENLFKTISKLLAGKL